MLYSYGEQMNPSGRLIYSAGDSKIVLLDLGLRKSEVIYDRSPDVALIERLTKVSDDKFLFQECPITETCMLKEFDLITKNITTLRKGKMPTYVAKANKLFFYSLTHDTNEKWLFVASLDASSTSVKVAKAPPRVQLPNGLLSDREAPALEISPDQVLFVGEDYHLWIYQIPQSTLRPTGIAHSLPVAWRSLTQDLICYDWDAKAYYQINLETKQTRPLPQYESAFGLLYIPQLDTLVYAKTRLYLFVSERYDIFAYEFSHDKEIKLQSNAGMATGIWLP